MSLINQMLRDLDARQVPTNRAEAAALQGMGLANARTNGQHKMLQRSGWAVGLILMGVLLQQGYQIWSDRQVQQVPVMPTVSELPLISQAPDLRSREAVSTPAPLETEGRVVEVVPKEIYRAPVPATVIVQTPIVNEAPPVIKKVLTPAQKAQLRFDRAQTLLMAEDFRKAADELARALELDPHLNEARIQLATLHVHHGRPDRALQLLERGYNANPEDAGTATFYARLLAGQGEYRQALEVLDAGIKPNTADADTLALAASLHYRMRQFSASASNYRDALARQPEQSVWWMGLGVSLEHDRQPTEALAAYQRANTASLDTASKNFVAGRITALSERTD